jgi:hypothetical protein
MGEKSSTGWLISNSVYNPGRGRGGWLMRAKVSVSLAFSSPATSPMLLDHLSIVQLHV